jgi:hypothetical protein
MQTTPAEPYMMRREMWWLGLMKSWFTPLMAGTWAGPTKDGYMTATGIQPYLLKMPLVALSVHA